MSVHHCKDKDVRTAEATRRGEDGEVSSETRGKGTIRKEEQIKKEGNESKYRKAAEKGPRKSSPHDCAFISIIVLL